ncbi:sulfite exporter TauE/SafE family protein [Salicola sp. Rm-C-2C1-2]|uniref:sulfite exporter TauE/SafE family protein n=1 Tax=Salicola sp. Rm-C-2C1-2 TaxID=3141321 RepID=UPI0032E38476
MGILEPLAFYLGLGAVAGTLAGLFGIGGGLIIVPALVFVFGWQGMSEGITAHLAVGTSLATVVFTSMSSIRTHHGKGAVRWDLFRPMAAGILLGAALGAVTAGMLSGDMLQRIIGVFVLLVAVKMVTGWSPRASERDPAKTEFGGVGGGIGWLSALVGIGGGTLTVPYLTWIGVRIQHAVGTSAACGLPIAVSGALANMVVGWGREGLPEYSIGFVFLPGLVGIALMSVPFARVGALLAHRLDERWLKRLFALLLVVVGARFLISG